MEGIRVRGVIPACCLICGGVFVLEGSVLICVGVVRRWSVFQGLELEPPAVRERGGCLNPVSR